MWSCQQAIVTIHKVTVQKAESHARGGMGIGVESTNTAEWELSFCVAGQAATLRFDHVHPGSELAVNRSFLVDLQQLQPLDLRVSGVGLDGASAGAALPAAAGVIEPLDEGQDGRTESVTASPHPHFAYRCYYDIRAHDIRAGASAAPAPAAIPQIPQIYAITRDGQLLGHVHDRARRDWAAPRDLGGGWQRYLRVLSGGAGVIYAVQPDGALLCFHREGDDAGGPWAEARQIGSGWQHFRRVFSGGDGVIYAIDDEGALWWHRHHGGGAPSDPGTWQGPNRVGGGWDEFSEVVAAGDGVIYAVVGRSLFAGPAQGGGVRYRKGDLLWYRHAGRLSGSCDWFEPRRIGRGWDSFSHLFSDGADTLYAIAAADLLPHQHGDLLRYRHLGHANGAWHWSQLQRAGRGWGGFTTVFAAIPLPCPSAP